MELWNRLIKFLKNKSEKDFIYKYLLSTFEALNTASIVKQEEILQADYYLKMKGY